MKLTPVSIQQRVDDISKQFAGTGWKRLPQELVDQILGYLLDDLNALAACSLTCKPLFGATRPLIHQRVHLVSRPTWRLYPKPKEPLFSLRKRGPEAFERLIDADRLGILRYTRYLTINMGDGTFNPENMQKYHPYLRSITNLQSLTLVPFRIHPFIPVFNECFGTFTSALRLLDIRNAYTTGRQLPYIISQFPLLEDLTIMAPIEDDAQPGHRHLVPAITHSPPLRGKLILGQVYSSELSDGLVALPGGLNCRSLEFFRCGDSQVVLEACGHSVTSISYMWCVWNSDGEQILLFAYISQCNCWTLVTPLDLKRSAVLERFEFTVEMYSISRVHEWIQQTLQTITSPLFSELVIWILHVQYPWSLEASMSAESWKAVDLWLNVLAERNPSFGVVFRGDFGGDFWGDSSGGFDAVRQHIEGICLPLASSKNLVKFEFVSNVENRFWKLGVP